MDSGVVAAIIVAGGGITAAAVTAYLNAKLKAIHLLVNDRLTEALNTIEDLRDELRTERRPKP